MATLATGTNLRTLARILQSAAAYGSQMWSAEGKPMTPTPEPVVSGDLLDLFSMLHARGVAYLLVGGVALVRSIEGRNTDDIDLVLSVESLASVPELV